MVAAANGQLKVVELLLRRGAASHEVSCQHSRHPPWAASPAAICWRAHLVAPSPCGDLQNGAARSLEPPSTMPYCQQHQPLPPSRGAGERRPHHPGKAQCAGVQEEQLAGEAGPEGAGRQHGLALDPAHGCPGGRSGRRCVPALQPVPVPCPPCPLHQPDAAQCARGSHQRWRCRQQPPPCAMPSRPAQLQLLVQT
jgi:hypothetical protein